MKQNRKQRYKHTSAKKTKKRSAAIKLGVMPHIDEPRIAEDPLEVQRNAGPIKHPQVTTGVRDR